MRTKGRRVALVLATALAVLAAILAWQTAQFVSQAAEATGTVTRLNPDGGPQIGFRTADGTEVSYPQAGFAFGYHAGDAVAVLYDPADPLNTARARTLGSLWGAPLILLAGGSGLLGLAATRRRERR